MPIRLALGARIVWRVRSRVNEPLNVVLTYLRMHDVGTSSEDTGATSKAVCEVCGAGTYSYEAASKCQDWSADAVE